MYQTILHTDSVPKRIFEKVNFEWKSADDNKSQQIFSMQIVSYM